MSRTAIPRRFPATSGDITVANMGPMLDAVLGARLVFSDRLDPQVLARAVRLVLDFEPVLGCWLDSGLRGAEWVRCAGLDECVPFESSESSDPERDATAFHNTPFDSRGPRLAVLLLRASDHDEVCIRFDHVAGDGWSAKEVTHLLAETYTRLSDDLEYDPEPRVSPRPDYADVWSAMTAEQREAAAKPQSMLSASKWKARIDSHNDGDLTVRTLTLSTRELAAVRQHAHERGATVNDAVITALIRSVAAIYPPAVWVRPGVSVSADTRRFATGADLNRIAMIATTQTVMTDYRHGEAFDETLQHVVDGVKPYKECLWNVGINAKPGAPPNPLLIRAIFGMVSIFMRATHMTSLLTMNIGAFDEERLAFGSLRPVSAVVTGVIPRFAGFPLTISSYQDRLTLWTAMRHKYMAPEVIDQFHAGVREQLEPLWQE